MDKMPLLVVLLVSIPEAFLVSWLTLSLWGQKTKFEKLLILAIVQGLIAYFVRKMPIPFGLHLPIMLLAYTLLLMTVYPFFGRCLLGIFIGVVIAGIVDSLSVPFVLAMFHISLKQYLAFWGFRVIGFLPEAVIFLLLILLVSRTKFNLQNITKFSAEKE